MCKFLRGSFSIAALLYCFQATAGGLELEEVVRYVLSQDSKGLSNPQNEPLIVIEDTLSSLGPKARKVIFSRNYFGSNSSQTLLTIAIAEGLDPIVKMILDSYSQLSMGTITFEGSFPLHIAAGSGAEKTVERLLELGANPDAENLHHATALHYAALSGSSKVASLLITAGAKVTARDENNLTALHIAAGTGNIDFAKELFPVKANRSCSELLAAEDSDGNTPLQIAQWEGRSEFTSWLETKYLDCGVIEKSKKKKAKPVGKLGVGSVFFEVFDEAAVGVSHFEGMGRGLRALKDIEEGALVAKYPLDLIDYEEEGSEIPKIVTLSDYALARPFDVAKFREKALKEQVDAEYAFECNYQGRRGLAFPLNPRNGRDLDDPRYVAHLTNDGGFLKFPEGIHWSRYNAANLQSSVYEFLNSAARNVNLRIDDNLMIEDGQPFIRMYAARKINKEEQLFLFYGHDYWARHYCKDQQMTEIQSEKLMKIFRSVEKKWLKEYERKGNDQPFWWGAQ